MSEVNEALEDLLEAQAGEGREAGEGVFTMSLEATLAKLAEFQLPFKGAWVVKVVQAAVASGCDSLRIESTSKETIFTFAPTPSWTLDELESAILRPQIRPEPDLRHLAAALWSVGMGGGRDFLLRLPCHSEALSWTPSKLERVSLEGTRPPKSTVLTVKHLPRNADVLSEIATCVSVAWQNSEVLTALRERCFTCPIELTLDSRRMDSLQLSQEHGWSSQTDLLSVSLGEGTGLPDFALSPYSFTLPVEARPGPSCVEAPAYDASGRALPSTCPLGLLVTLHASRGNKGACIRRSGSSHLYWVQDGAVVESWVWLVGEGLCSLGCVISAEGLPTDLSTLRLRESPDLSARARLAAESCLRILTASEWSSLERWVEAGSAEQRKVGKVFLGLGVVLLPLIPLSVSFMIAGGLSYALAGTDRKAIQSEITESLAALKGRVESYLTET